MTTVGDPVLSKEGSGTLLPQRPSQFDTGGWVGVCGGGGGGGGFHVRLASVGVLCPATMLRCT